MSLTTPLLRGVLAVSVDSRTNKPKRVQLGLTAHFGLYLGVVTLAMSAGGLRQQA